MRQTEIMKLPKEQREKILAWSVFFFELNKEEVEILEANDEILENEDEQWVVDVTN